MFKRYNCYTDSWETKEFCYGVPKEVLPGINMKRLAISSLSCLVVTVLLAGCGSQTDTSAVAPTPANSATVPTANQTAQTGSATYQSTPIQSVGGRQLPPQYRPPGQGGTQGYTSQSTTSQYGGRELPPQYRPPN